MKRSETQADVGAALRNLRERSGMSLGDLERKAGVRKSHIWQIERGTANPTLSVLMVLLDALGGQLRIHTRVRR